MYIANQKLTAPENPNEKIWRYMDFTKYLSLLSTQALFFCRVDKLGDKNEMTLPLANQKNDIEFYNHHEEKIKRATKGAITLEIWLSIWDYTKKSIVINSWHRNNFESAAMWSVYLKTNEGIAIQSNFKRLCDSFQKSSDDVNIGIVNYKDYYAEIIEDETIFGWVSHKLKSYEYERELRAIVTNQMDDKLKPLHEVGKYISIDLNTLIETVYVAPNADKWYTDLVIEVTRKYGYNYEIKTSELNDRSLH